MDQRAVHDQWNGHGDVEQGEPVGKEDPRPFGNGRDLVKHEQEQNQPQDGVDRLDGELGRGEEQGEERDVTGHGKRTERAEVPAIFQCDQAEGNDDQEHCLFMDVPAEQERGISAEGDGANECLPVGSKPEFG